jgi:hypothetical protein
MSFPLKRGKFDERHFPSLLEMGGRVAIELTIQTAPWVPKMFHLSKYITRCNLKITFYILSTRYNTNGHIVSVARNPKTVSTINQAY